MLKKKNIIKKCWLPGIFLFGILQGASLSYCQTIPEPTQRDACPVCGMFVAQYPNWIATVLYQDRVSHHFDGPKDCFTYLLDMEKWAQGRDKEKIQSIIVKEYYGLNQIDARKAYYVIGSDVLGPMGHELIPLATLEDAQAFMRDHHGKKIYRFSDINKNILSILNSGVFE